MRKSRFLGKLHDATNRQQSAFRERGGFPTTAVFTLAAEPSQNHLSQIFLALPCSRIGR
jgi:hypothetical protein